MFSASRHLGFSILIWFGVGSPQPPTVPAILHTTDHGQTKKKKRKKNGVGYRVAAQPIHTHLVF